MTRDILQPDGTVRKNVGSDNLSDDDRRQMEYTDDQILQMNLAKAQESGELCAGCEIRTAGKLFCTANDKCVCFEHTGAP